MLLMELHGRQVKVRKTPISFQILDLALPTPRGYCLSGDRHTESPRVGIGRLSGSCPSEFGDGVSPPSSIGLYTLQA